MIDYIPWLYNIIKKTLNSKHTAKLKIKSQRYRNTNDINHTHMKKVGTLQNFLFAIYWWTLKNPKNENLKKWKQKEKLLEISFYQGVPKATIIWGTVPEIQS